MIPRSMLKSLKSGKPVQRNAVQQTLFSALYAVDDADVKQCLHDIHAMLVRGDGKQVQKSRWGELKSFVGVGSTSPNMPAVSTELVTPDERKQLIFGLGLALSSPKFQKPTLEVRRMNIVCAQNKSEKDPNRLVRLTVGKSKPNQEGSLETIQSSSSWMWGRYCTVCVSSQYYSCAHTHSLGQVKDHGKG